jgi:HTH-type transcriptional regulator, sugar sensing transcriptional regulator
VLLNKFKSIRVSGWQALKTKSRPFIKVFIEFFYHDVALAKITEKHSELMMNDEEIKSVLMKLRY